MEISEISIFGISATTTATFPQQSATFLLPKTKMRVLFIFCCLIAFALSQELDDDECTLKYLLNREILENPIAQVLYNKLTYYNSSCGDNCSYINGFSCVTASFPKIQLSNCSSTEYPICMGRIEVNNNCKTLDCCNQLNKQVLPNLYPITTLTSINYYMKFFNDMSEIIPCEDFDSFSGDKCIQFADYAASSDRYTCNSLDAIYTSGAEQMSFDLF